MVCGNLLKIAGTLNNLIYKVDSISLIILMDNPFLLSTMLTLLRCKLNLAQSKKSGKMIDLQLRIRLNLIILNSLSIKHSKKFLKSAKQLHFHP
jgi:hypothetical protein